MAFDVGAVVGRLELNIKGWKDSVQTVKEDQKSLAGFALRHGDEIKKLGKSLAIAGGAATAAFGLMIKGAADAGDNINDLSQRTGIATEILSGHKLAADKSGTSLEGFATGMRGLSNQMDAANRGGADAVGLFNTLGVSFKNADGSLRPLNDVFLDVADRLSKMPDGAQKTALAMDAFGRSGMDLIPMLNMGRDGLQANYDITKKLNGIWEKDAAQAADKFNDSLAELKTVTGGLGKEIGMALMPMVKDFIEKARDTIASVSAWAKEHPGLTQAIGGTGLALGGLATGMGTFIMIAGTMVTKIIAIASALSMGAGALTALLGVWGAAATAVAFLAGKYIDLGNAENYAIKAGQTLREVQMNLVDKLSAAASAADWQFGRMSKLIDAYDGNIAALAMAIEKGKEGKDIQEALAKVGKEHAEAIDKQRLATEGLIPPINTLLPKMKDVVSIIETAIPAANDLRDAFFELGAEIVETPIPAAKDLKFALEAIPGAMPAISTAAETTTRETKSYFDGLFNDIAQGFGNTIQEWLSGATTFKDFMKGLWGDIKDAFFTVIGEMVAEWTVNFVKKLIDDAADVGSSIAKNVGGALSGVGGAAGSMAGSFLTAASSVANIVTAVASVISLFKKAPTGAGDGMGRVVERQDQQTSLLTIIKDFCWNDIHVGLLNLGRIMDSVTAGGWTNNWLKKIDTDILGVKAAILGVPGAAEGLTLTSPGLVMTHGTPSLPEYIVPSAKMGAMGPGGGGKIEVHVHVEGQVITDRDYFRKRVIPEMTEAARAGLMKAFQESMVGA